MFGKLKRSHHRNVLTDGFIAEELTEGTADAIFLDLPKPQDSVPHVVKVLRRGGRICSFSPCIEQIVSTATSLAKSGFADITTVECLEREYSRKIVRDKSIFPAESETVGQPVEDQGRTVFAVGDTDDRTHTGFLLFATKYLA